MSEYKPSSRRPIADVFRLTANGAVRLCLRWSIHPDAVSYSSMVAAAAAGICFWQSCKAPWLFIPAALFCYLRLWLNMLDGMVALASGKASRHGELLNELPDRVSDVVIFVGVAHSGWCNSYLGYWAAILALFTAYVGMFGQALRVQREFSGIMTKPWRMVALHIGSWITLGMFWCGVDKPAIYGHSILSWTLFVVIVGCLQTVAVRLRRIVRALKETPTEGN